MMLFLRGAVEGLPDPIGQRDRRCCSLPSRPLSRRSPKGNRFGGLRTEAPLSTGTRAGSPRRCHLFHISTGYKEFLILFTISFAFRLNSCTIST